MRRIYAAFAAMSLTAVLGGCSVESRTDTANAEKVDSFTFRGLIPNVTTMQEARKAGIVQDCREDSCGFVKSMVGGTPAGTSTVAFKNDAFDWFSFRPASEDYDQLLVTLKQAYGEPCEMSSVPLQNAMGARFSGDQAQWCFKEGNLTLRRHSTTGRDSFRGDLDFFTAHPEAVQRPTNFTADTL